LTLFTFLRMCCLASYLYFETRNQNVHDYMTVNWINWPKTSNISAFKKRVK